MPTTYAYRFFGTLNNLPVDITFTCNPAPSSVSAEDTTMVKLSDQVSRISKGGAFGCPLAKADLGFPETSMSISDLNAKINSPAAAGNGSKNLGVAAIILSLIGIAVAGYAVSKK